MAPGVVGTLVVGVALGDDDGDVLGVAVGVAVVLVGVVDGVALGDDDGDVLGVAVGGGGG